MQIDQNMIILTKVHYTNEIMSIHTVTIQAQRIQVTKYYIYNVIKHLLHQNEPNKIRARIFQTNKDFMVVIQRAYSRK